MALTSSECCDLKGLVTFIVAYHYMHLQFMSGRPTGSDILPSCSCDAGYVDTMNASQHAQGCTVSTVCDPHCDIRTLLCFFQIILQFDFKIND